MVTVEGVSGGIAFEARNELVAVTILRACGHQEVITIQPPIDYVQWCARQERCSRCKARPVQGRHGKHRIWWIGGLD